MTIGALPALATAAALAVLLSGCQGAPQPVSTGSASPPADLLVPESVLPIACSDVLDLDSRAGFFGAPLVVVADESLVRGVDDALARQAGALQCAWSTDPTIYQSQTPGFSVIALPDADADYRARLRPVVELQYTTIDTAGDLSQFQCAFSACGFDLLVDGYWLSGGLVGAEPTPDDVMRAEMQSALEELVGVVRNAGDPRAAWTEPEGVASGWGISCTDGDPIVTGIETAFGLEGVSSAGGGYESISGAIWDRAGSGRCVAGNNDVWVGLSYAPGGAWAFEHFSATLAWPHFGEYHDGIAADGNPVRWSCDGPVTESDCNVFAVIEGGLLSVIVSDLDAQGGPDAEAIIAALPELAATIRAAGTP
jgi:hypothetical protein